MKTETAFEPCSRPLYFSVFQTFHTKNSTCTHGNKKQKTQWQCLQFCWGNLWRYFCTVCPQSGSILHICTQTHRAVYRKCWWELQTLCPRRHTLPWACTGFSSTPTLYLHTHTHTESQKITTTMPQCLLPVEKNPIWGLLHLSGFGHPMPACLNSLQWFLYPDWQPVFAFCLWLPDPAWCSVSSINAPFNSVASELAFGCEGKELGFCYVDEAETVLMKKILNWSLLSPFMPARKPVVTTSRLLPLIQYILQRDPPCILVSLPFCHPAISYSLLYCPALVAQLKLTYSPILSSSPIDHHQFKSSHSFPALFSTAESAYHLLRDPTQDLWQVTITIDTPSLWRFCVIPLNYTKPPYCVCAFFVLCPVLVTYLK